MDSDSDDDFERFLQEDDSASVSSASPLKKKTSVSSRSSKPSESRRKSSSGRDKAISIVDAAEKLLAGSGRSKKKVAAVEDAEEEEEEAPPPYSDDPYAFDLDYAPTRFGKQDRQDSESDADDSAFRSRRKSKKGKNDDFTKRKKSSTKSSAHELLVTQKETRPTLEERVAEILKRTGSTTFQAGVADEERAESDEERKEKEDDLDAGSRDTKSRISLSKMHKIESVIDSKDSMTQPVIATNAGEESADTSDLHRLSFSDSLGIDSTDFEVGALAKRKLDRSRLSLSSINSEKFAVNLEALDESEQVSHNRYSLNPEDVHKKSVEASDAFDSDYENEHFELDQTTDASAFEPGTKDSNIVEANTSQPSFVSEFENMKNLFSLESPIKEEWSKHEVLPVEETTLLTGAQAPSVEYDNFGYDDEDFEGEESKEPDKADTAFPVLDPYANDRFEGDDRLARANPPSDGLLVTPGKGIDNGEVQRAREDPSAPHELTTNAPLYDPQPVPLPSGASDRYSPLPSTQNDSHFLQLSHNRRISPTPPQSPPPPPPPDDEETPHKIPSPTDKRTPQAHAVNVERYRVPSKSVERFREIEHQVSSLRFISNNPSKERARRTNAKLSQDESVQTVVFEDPQLEEELRVIDRMVEEARKMRLNKSKSAAVRSSARESELALRLQQAQRQLLQLKHHIFDENEEDVSAGFADGDRGAISQGNVHPDEQNVKSALSNDELNVVHEENHRLQKEVQTQERLIQGFQRENEHLMKQLKQVQREVSYDVHKENETLRTQLKDLRALLDGAQHLGNQANPVDGVASKVQFRAAVEARLHAEAVAESLREDLATLTKRHQDRVNELKIELEKVKKAKVDLECRYEGFDLDRVEAESRQIKQLSEQLQVQKTEHNHAIAAMQKKIDWYVNNQRLLDEQDDQLKSLKEENKSLKERLNESKNERNLPKNPDYSPINPAKTGHRHAADVRRIQELEARLSEMEEAMRRRHPDSLVSLMVASRKVEEESKISELEEKHRQQLADLATELEEAQAANEKKLNVFRQQQEKLILQYQKQIADLERLLATRDSQRVAATTTTRSYKKRNEFSNAEETELYRVRRFYAEKIKDIERKWEAKYRSLKKQHYAANGTDSEWAGSSPVDKTHIIRNLQQKIASQDEHIRNLRSAPHEPKAWEVSDLRRRVSSLELQLRTSEEARRQLVDTIGSLNTIAPSMALDDTGPDQAIMTRVSELEQELSSQQKEHEVAIKQSQERIRLLEQQVTDHSTATQSLLTQISNHVREVERMQKLLVEAEQEKRRLQARADRVAQLESEIARLRDQAAVPQTPSMLQFSSLELRIETLTQKHQLREAELKVLLAQATQSSQLEKLNYERMYQNAITLKNAEIARFKKQLGEILDELEALRRPGATKV